MLLANVMTIDSNIQLPALQSPDTAHIIRQISNTDLLALHADCWSHRSVKRCQEILKTINTARKRQRGMGIVVAGDVNKIIAYGQIMRLSKCIEISDLVVSEKYRSQGIGTAMIQYLIASIPDESRNIIEIGVAESNPRALALYQRLGFKRAYELRLKLTDGRETVVYLRLDLST